MSRCEPAHPVEMLQPPHGGVQKREEGMGFCIGTLA